MEKFERFLKPQPDEELPNLQEDELISTNESTPAELREKLKRLVEKFAK